MWRRSEACLHALVVFEDAVGMYTKCIIYTLSHHHHWTHHRNHMGRFPVVELTQGKCVDTCRHTFFTCLHFLQTAYCGAVLVVPPQLSLVFLLGSLVCYKKEKALLLFLSLFLPPGVSVIGQLPSSSDITRGCVRPPRCVMDGWMDGSPW